jgi:hypothetical protein
MRKTTEKDARQDSDGSDEVDLFAGPAVAAGGGGGGPGVGREALVLMALVALGAGLTLHRTRGHIIRHWKLAFHADEAHSCLLGGNPVSCADVPAGCASEGGSAAAAAERASFCEHVHAPMVGAGLAAYTDARQRCSWLPVASAAGGGNPARVLGFGESGDDRSARAGGGGGAVSAVSRFEYSYFPDDKSYYASARGRGAGTGDPSGPRPEALRTVLSARHCEVAEAEVTATSRSSSSPSSGGGGGGGGDSTGGHSQRRQLPGRMIEEESDAASDTGSSGRGGGSRWVVTRVGPFRSAGGNDWHYISWDRFGRLAFDEEDGGAARSASTWVTASMIAAVDPASFQPLGYPPIHIHHAHIELPVTGPQNRGRHGHRVMFQSHGDSACMDRGPSHTGTDCLLQLYPPGTGFLLDPNAKKKLWFNAEINDVRIVSTPHTPHIVCPGTYP